MPLLQRNPDIPFLDIRLQNDVLVFRGASHESGGAQLKGSLVFAVAHTIHVRQITLQLQGVKRLQWTERGPAPVSGLMAPNSKTIKHEEIFYNKQWDLVLPGQGQHLETLKRDNYEYPFETILDGDLPESIEGLGTSHVIYRLKARLVRGKWAHDNVAKKHLRIVRTLGPESLELSQTMSVENLWPNKVEYSISIPTKAVVFGTWIPIDIVLVPLLKGLVIGKVVCALKETHILNCAQKNSSKSDTRHISTQTFENGFMEEGLDPDMDMGRWLLKDKVVLPKTLNACVQDCEVTGIKVKHKLKFTIQLHNPDGHMSELRASLPVMLFISPNYLMGDDQRIPSDAIIEEDEVDAGNAPPRYDEHYLDRLYEGLQTPTALSGANTPAILSRSNSLDDLQAAAISDSGSPLVLPDANSRRWQGSRSHGATPATTPGIESPPVGMTPAGMIVNGLGLEGGDYFGHANPSEESSGANSNATSSRSHSRQVSRAPSPEEDATTPTSGIDIGSLSRVPSYNTATKAGNVQLADDLPCYEPGGFTSAPVSPFVSPATSPAAGHGFSSRPRMGVRSHTANFLHLGRHNNNHGHGHQHNHSADHDAQSLRSHQSAPNSPGLTQSHRSRSSHAIMSLGGLLEGHSRAS